MPQLSITAFTGAVASWAGTKRKIDEVNDDEYDSDEIQVATASPRPPLHTIPPAQAQNERPRVLDCVLIPAYKRTNGQTTLTKKSVPAVRTVTTTARKAPTSRSSRSRPAKSKLIHEETSDDELSLPTKRPKPKTKKASSKAQIDRDFDFEDAVSATEGEAFVASESERTNSDASMDDGSDGDDEPSKTKPKSTAQKKTTTSNSTTSAKSGAKNKSAKGAGKSMTNLISRETGFDRGLDLNLRPLHTIEDIFEDMTTKAFKLDLDKPLQHFRGKKLRVATMCSGTESPLLALEMIRDSVKRQSEHDLIIDHAFSAEIVPFKQAYIERNFNPPLIFRDITELTEAVKDEIPMATTAYGSKAQVPTDIHMVIAGTSCVDFSNLNKYKKTLEDEGESGKTWEAVFSFCAAFKPPIVLLENIKGAEWDKMQDQFRSVGYEAAGVHVDTKNYYLPQTRQRGYMVCFDAKRVKASGIAAPAEKWQSLMSKFQRYSSSPATSFLLPSDSLSKHNQGIADENKREIDWVRCAERHVRYRQEKRLGTKRPMTYWQESGSMIVPENGIASWYHDQVERVLDLMDCSLLRKANSEMYDVRFKTRIWDVSQNVDMNEDGAAFGIANCITPAGLAVASDGGRALSAQENLKLQGIPLSKISLTTETPRELQDLAGNAMSSTVVGSAILSALLAGHEVVSDFPKSDMSCLSQTITRTVIDDSREAASSLISCEDDFHDISSLLNIADRTIRRCFCEGGSTVTKKDLQRCCDCGHTTCTACGGNPQHNYRHDQSLSKGRMLPSDAEEAIRSKLPLRIRFTNIREAINSFRTNMKSSMTAVRYFDLIAEGADEVFSLHGFRRARNLTVDFQSQSGQSHLELILDGDCAEWQLFIHASPDLAANDALREALRQPVAKSRVSHSLLDGEWSWRLPSMKTVRTTVQGSGSEVPTWWARVGLPNFRHHKQPRFLRVQIATEERTSLTAPLEGSYEYLPRCGTACDSLYKQVDGAPSPEGPMFLFLDPTRVGAPDADRFVFSRDHERLDYDEKRAIGAEVEASWRPWKHGQEERTVTVMVDDWTQSSVPGTLQPLPTTLEMRERTVHDLSAHENSCSQPLELIACSLSDSAPPASCWELVSPQNAHFFAQNAWLFEAVRRRVGMDKWNSLELSDIANQCSACSPKKPELRWKLSDNGDYIKPYEDSSSAADYERAIKSRPTAIVVEAGLAVGTSAPKIRLGVNLVSMVHRVRALLASSFVDVAYSWRLRAETTSSSNYSFKPFNLKALSHIQPYSGSLDMTIQLFPNQLKSLAWMRQQESGSGRVFHIEEAVEEKPDQLGWTLEMRARAAVHIRGGICADHPGYGKTITSLALVQAQFQDQSPKEVIQELSERQHGNAPGLIPSAATVVICPRTLVDQWAEEASDKLGFKVNTDILTFKKDADFDKKTLEQLTHAKLIIISTNVIGSEAYLERLAALAGVPGPAAAKGRAFEEWLHYALDLIPDKLKILQQSGRNELRRHAQESYSLNVNSEQFKAAVPSRRLRGKDFVAAQKAKSTASLTKFAAPKNLDISLIGSPLLHMFYLNRVVCDEFHNYDSREVALIRALKKDKIWGLSGTPPAGDFCDISRMGQLLGIDLPIGAHSRGVMKQKNIQLLRKEMTDFERFDSMRQPVSQSVLARTNDLLQEFLDNFVTRNLTDFKIDFHDYLVPVRLDLDHRSVYTEVSQYLNSIEMRLKKGSKAKTTDREERLNDVTTSSETAEEALSKLAAYFDREVLSMGTSDSGLEALFHRRRTETAERETALRKAISKGEKGESVVFEQWRQGRLHLDNLGDQATLDAVLDSCNKSDEKSKELAATKLPNGKKHDTSQGLTSAVNAMVSRLLVSKRSLRFVETLNRIHKSAEKQSQEKICANADCHSGSPEVDIGVSAFCGHVVCQTCYQRQKERGDTQCPASDCHAPINDHDILWRSRIKGLHGSKEGSCGAKIDATVKLLKTIRKQGDQAVLFVQFDKQLDDLNQALDHHGIPAAFVDSATTARSNKPIEEFKSNSDLTVMVLNASDETATGLNLQNANHVIFLSPLLRDQQYAYDATMAQAIGRVRRHGQQKQIHVYRIVALDTIDVDILEHRERRTNAITEQGAPAIEHFSHVPLEQVSDDVKPERTQLVKENGVFSLRPQSWLMMCGPDEDQEELEKVRNADGSNRVLHEQRVKMKGRVMGWENFSSLIKFSRAYTEDDE